MFCCCQSRTPVHPEPDTNEAPPTTCRRIQASHNEIWDAGGRGAVRGTQAGFIVGVGLGAFVPELGMPNSSARSLRGTLVPINDPGASAVTQNKLLLIFYSTFVGAVGGAAVGICRKIIQICH